MTLHRGSHRSRNPPYHSPIRVMNHYQSASTSSSQVPLSADLPDLYYEQGYRTPSVTSSDMLSTPPRHSQTPWMQEYPNDVRENSVAYMSSWQTSPMDSCQSKRPTVAPIDTSFNWGLYDTSPMSYTSNEFNRVHEVANGHRATHSHPFTDNDPTMGFSSMSDSSSTALIPSSSISDPSTSLSHIMDPSTSSSHINQPPLKLHQPRPSRRIPIISLSNLASACDDLATHVQEPKRHASEEAPFPLSLDFNRIPPMMSPPAVDGGNTHQLKYMLYPTSNVYSPTYGVGYDGHFGKAILCNCGCMESFTFR